MLVPGYANYLPFQPHYFQFLLPPHHHLRVYKNLCYNKPTQHINIEYNNNITFSVRHFVHKSQCHYRAFKKCSL